MQFKLGGQRQIRYADDLEELPIYAPSPSGFLHFTFFKLGNGRSSIRYAEDATELVSSIPPSVTSFVNWLD